MSKKKKQLECARCGQTTSDVELVPVQIYMSGAMLPLHPTKLRCIELLRDEIDALKDDRDYWQDKCTQMKTDGKRYPCSDN